MSSEHDRWLGWQACLSTVLVAQADITDKGMRESLVELPGTVILAPNKLAGALSRNVQAEWKWQYAIDDPSTPMFYGLPVEFSHAGPYGLYVPAVLKLYAIEGWGDADVE